MDSNKTDRNRSLDSGENNNLISGSRFACDHKNYMKRACGVVFKDSTWKEVLLATSRKDENMWILPGGKIEQFESPDDAVKREVFEEAGVHGDVFQFIGTITNDERKTSTLVFIMVYDHSMGTVPNIEGKKVGWFDVDEALSLLEHRLQMLNILNSALEFLSKDLMIPS